MPLKALISVSILLLSSSAFAQDWTEYINKEDGFRVDFPGQPTITTTTFKSMRRGFARARLLRRPWSRPLFDYRRRLPRHSKDRRRAGKENVSHELRRRTLVRPRQRRPGYWKEELGGALLHAMYTFIKRDAKVTHLAWAWQDLVEGIELQLTNNSDQSRTFVHISMHKNRLYIVEGTVPGNYPPPGLFQQSMGTSMRRDAAFGISRSTRT